MKIENKMKKYRKACGLTQAQLAEAVGCTQSRIADYEAERYSIEKATLGFALKVAEALGCTVEEIFTEQ